MRRGGSRRRDPRSCERSTPTRGHDWARVSTGFRYLDRDQAGRAERIALGGAQERVVRGEVLREVLARAFGGRAIKSTWFDVRPERTLFVFEGRGFGHGVGLCQAGALARIRAGAKPAAVLQRYFPGYQARGHAMIGSFVTNH